MIMWGLGGSYHVLTDVPVDNCKLASVQFAIAPLLELISMGGAAPLRRSRVTFNLRVLNSRFCLFIFF